MIGNLRVIRLLTNRGRERQGLHGTLGPLQSTAEADARAATGTHGLRNTPRNDAVGKMRARALRPRRARAGLRMTHAEPMQAVRDSPGGS